MRINFVPDSISASGSTANLNNPGGIRYRSDVTWQGQVGQDSGFVKFESMAYGYRALIKNLQAYITDHYDTINKIINRWAPPEDGNNTQSYIQNVIERTGIPGNKKLTAGDLASVAKIAAAISQSEVGQVYADDLAKGLAMVTEGVTKRPKVVDWKSILTMGTFIGIVLQVDKLLDEQSKRHS